MDLNTIRTYAREKADEESSGFIDSDELTRHINQGLKFVYGKIVQRFENYFIVRGDQGSNPSTFATTDVNTVSDEITVSRSFRTGDPVLFKTTGTLPTGLSTATTYYAIRVSSTVIKVASTQANADALTAIDLTTVGSGTHTIANSGMFNTVSETQVYNIPCDLMKFVRVEHRQNGSTSEDDWLSLRSLNIANDNVRAFYPPREGWGPGPGFGYFITGNKINLRPTPTSVFQVRLYYIPRVAALVADSDVPGVPEEYHELLAEYGAIQMLAKSGEGLFRERSETFKLELDNLLETIEIRDQQPEQMHITDEYDFDIIGFGPV